MATVSEQIQQIYIGLLGRAADQGGLAYWTAEIEGGNLTIEQLRANIVNEQPEYAAGLGSQTRAQVVASLYENLFERAPESEGLDYWVNGGGSTVNIDQLVLALTNGASAADRLVLDNKIEAAEYYTANVEDADYNSEQAAQVVADVDATVASVEAAKAYVDALDGDIPGDTLFTLQENTEVIGASAGQAEVTETVTYWGDPTTGEGIRLTELVEYVKTLTGLDFHQLGLINIANGDDDGLNSDEAGTPGSSLEVNGGIDPNDLENISVTTGDVAGEVIVTVTASDGTIHQAEAEIAVEYIDFLNDLLLDGEDGESRLFEKEIIISDAVSGSAGQEVLKPIVLTTDQNNGGTIETGYTSTVDNTIVAGRLDLLHRAYIDGGNGDNTLEINAKGVWAQPSEVLNVQHVTIQNLPNVYTTIDDDGQPVNTYTDLTGWGVSGTGEFLNSVIDVSNVRDIETLTITEGDFEGLTVYDLEAGVAQQSVVNLDSTTAVGETFTVTINGVDVTVTAVDNGTDPDDDTAAVITKLVDAINADPTLGSMVDASAGTNSINLTGDVAGATFTVAVSGTGDITTLPDPVVEAEAPATSPNAISLGGLTIAGVRNGATAQVDGHFSQDVTVHYGEIQGDGVDLILSNVNFTSGADLVIAHNSPTLNIESTGGHNVLEDADLAGGNGNNGSLTNLNISGDAKLYIEDSLSDEFASGTPAYIDASANTAGVDLNIDGHNDEVHFVGTESANDHFQAHLDGSGGRNITLVGGHGDGEYDLETDGDVTVTVGEGDNEIEAWSYGNDASGGDELEGTVSVVAGGGQNDINVGSTDAFTIVVGDGDNVIEATGGAFAGVTATETDASWVTVGDGANQINATAGVLVVTAGDGSNIIEIDGDDDDDALTAALPIISATVTAGDGGNRICVEDLVSGTVETGAGDDVVEITGFDGIDSAVTVNAGEGNNTISVEAVEDVAVTTGAGDDSITIVGGNVNLDSDDGAPGQLSGENGNETLLVIDAGAGNNTITLGTDDASSNAAITAIDGSSITGENITLVIQSETDLSRADVSGVTAVQLGNGDELTLTVSQFVAMGGSAAFSVIGESFNGQSVINLIVDQDTSLDDLDIESLPRSIDLSFEVKDDVTLEMTAQQLHERVTDAGVTAYVDDNGDFGAGTVYITDAGEDFDPYDITETGSINEGAASLHLRLDASPDGYERPIDPTSYSRVQIDTDELTDGVQTPFDTAHTFLRIIGDSDFNFTPVAGGIDEWGQPIPDAGDSIQLGGGTDGFLVDFSSVGGTVSGLTLENFENVDAIYGNGGARVDTKLAGDVASDDQGLVSSGISTFVVVDVDVDPTADTDNDTVFGANANAVEEVQFWTCETTQHLEVLGLQGNYDAEVTFGNTERGVSFLLETVYSKADGYVVGAIDGQFARDGADAVVNVVALDAVPADETQKVLGIELSNADTVTINVTGGDTEVEGLVTNDATELTVTADADLELPQLADDLESFDASGVVGDLTVSVETDGADNGLVFVGAAGSTTLVLGDVDAGDIASIDGAGGVNIVMTDAAADTADLTATTLGNIASISIAAGDTVQLTIDQALEIGAANITGAGTLTLTELSDQEFSLANFDVNVTTTTLRVVEEDEVTLNPATDLTGITTLEVIEGTTLNMTAAQFQQLNGNLGGIITVIDGADAGAGVDTSTVSINITDLSAADVAAAALDTSNITADNITITTSESVTLVDATDLSGVDSITLADGTTLSVEDVEELDGIDVTGVNGIINILDEVLGGVTDIDASGFDVAELHMTNSLLQGGVNVDLLFTGLPFTVAKVIYQGEGIVIEGDQTVTVQAQTTVVGTLEFNKLALDTEVQNFTLNLAGGVEIDSVDLSSSVKEDALGNPLLNTHLESVTINSTGTEGNLQTGETTNIMDTLSAAGTVTGGGAGAGDFDGNGYVDTSEENNLLNVTINADQDLQMAGITFSAVNGDDTWAVNDEDAATATVTITGAADVALGDLNSDDDDVDAVVVNNTGSGNVSATIDAANIDGDDALSFTGGNIALTTAGAVDLSDDDVSGVSTITVEEGGVLTLTYAQYVALGASALSVTDTDSNPANDAATLVITGYDGNAFDATEIASEFDVQIETAAGDITLDAGVDLSGVDEITVMEDGSLTLSASQYQQMEGDGDINGQEADGTASTDYTVNVTGLTQANVDLDLNNDGDTADAGEGFDLSNVDADTITVDVVEDVDFDANTNLNGASVTISSFHLGLATQAQATGLTVTGDAASIVSLLFVVAAVDAAGYDIGTLRVFDTSLAGNDVEQVIDNLANSIVLNVFETTNEVGFVSNINRVVVIEPGTQIGTPGGQEGLFFNAVDEDGREMRTLDITFSGDATDRTEAEDQDGNIEGAIIYGDLVITADDGHTLEEDLFGTLTLRSEGTGDSNAITGDVTSDATGGIAGDDDNNLLDVQIVADAAFTIGGSVVFNSEVASQNEATLSVTGTEAVTIASLDTTDADIDVLNINNDAGLLNLIGASPSILADNTESIVITGTGDITIGNDDGDTADGIDGGEELSTIDASGHSGALSIENVQSADENLFTFTSGSGETNVTFIGITIDDDGDANTASGWTLDFSAADTGSELHLGANTYTDGNLTIDLGAGTTLYIDATTDWTTLDSLTISQANAIVLADEVTLTLTAAQANGLNITTVDTDGDGNFATVNIINLGDTEVDLSGIDANIAGLATLEDDDVTVHANSDLGSFSIGLDVNSTADDNLTGQTIRFNTEEQAARDILVDVDGDGSYGEAGDNAADVTGSATTNSSNVVWLFDSVTGPVDTSGYDSNLGRLFLTEDLINGANVESDLYTTLPDAILRVDFADLADLATVLNSVGVNRTLELVHFVNIPGNLTFSDTDNLEHMETLTVNLGGEVVVGNITIDNMATPGPGETINVAGFNTLTINSELADATGDLLASEGFDDTVNVLPVATTPNQIGDIAAGTSPDVDLLDVDINAPADGAQLEVGTITFSSNTAASTGTLDVNNALQVDIDAVDSSDTDVDTVTITKAGLGALNILGASPAAAVDGTETLNIVIDNNDGLAGGAVGDVTFGTAGDATKPGISSDILSTIAISSTGGADTVNLDLGVIESVDSVDFTMTNSDTDITVTATVEAEIDGSAFETLVDAYEAALATYLVDTTLTASQNALEAAYAALAAGSNNPADFTLAGHVAIGQGGGPAATATDIGADANFTWDFDLQAGDTITFNANTTFTGGRLNVEGATVVMDGNVDMSGMAALTGAGFTLTVDAGDTLTIPAALADGVTITGLGSVIVTDLEDAPAADLSNIATTSIEAQVDSTGDVTLTADFGTAQVTITGDGTVTIGAGATNVNTASFTVGAAATLAVAGANGDADGLIASGLGTVTVDDLGADTDADLSTITTSTVTATVTTSGTTFTGNLGTAVVTIADTTTWTTSYTISTGNTINHDGTEDAQALVITIDAVTTPAEAAADLNTITTDITNVTANFVDDVIFTGDLNGFDATVAATKTLTATAAILDGTTITGAGSVAATALDATLAADLSGITVAGTRTATFDNSGTFTGDLGTFTVQIADDQTMTVAANVAVGNVFNADPAGVTVDGIVAVTLSSANAGDLTADLNTVTGTATSSFTVLNSLTFTGDLHDTEATQVVDGAVLSTTLDIADTETIDKVAGGTTGAVTLDASGSATGDTDTIAGSADFTVNDLIGTLTATGVTGDLDVVTEADAAVAVALGGGTNTVDARLLEDAQVLTLTNDQAVTVQLSDGDLTATAIATAAATVTATDGTNVINTGGGDDVIDGGAGDDTIDGGDGADRIIGGTGADDIDAGNGNDTVAILAGNHVVAGEDLDGEGGGIDVLSIETSDAVDLSLANIANFEVLDMELAAGDSDANVTVSAAQFDAFSLFDADGSDRLTIDTLSGGDLNYGATDADDTFVFAAGDAGITITNFTVGAGNDILDVRGLVNSVGALAHQNTAGTAIAEGSAGNVAITDLAIIYVSTADISTYTVASLEADISSAGNGDAFDFQTNGDEAIFVVGEGAGTDGVKIFHATDADITNDAETVTLVGTITGINLTGMDTDTLE